jgi:hypothetical protein
MKLADELDEKKKMTEDAIRRNHEQLAFQRKQEVELRSKLADIDPEEAERRAQHMREQRDILISKKKIEREKKVQVESEKKSKTSAEDDFALADAVHHIRSSYNNTDGAKNAEQKSEDLNELRRSSLRMALARRMKNDLFKNEEAKMSLMQEEQFSELDKKLLQVEQLREDNKKREYIMSKQLERQQAQIARNVRLSAANLTKDN